MRESEIVCMCVFVCVCVSVCVCVCVCERERERERGATIKIQSLSFEAIGQAPEKNTVESFHFQSEIKNQCYKTNDFHFKTIRCC